MVLTLFGVSIIVFIILRVLPGNALTSALGTSAGLLTHAQRVALDHYYGIGQPLLQQYWSWLARDSHRQPRRVAVLSNISRLADRGRPAGHF